MPFIPLMHLPSLDVGARASSPCQPRKQIRFRRAFLAALTLSIAGTSAALLVRVGEPEVTADQAMLDALRQTPGLST